MLPKRGFNVLGICNFKQLRVAEIAHPTTIARLIGRSVFSGMARINFLRAEIFHSTFKQTGLRYSSRQFLSLRYGWGRCGSPHHQGAGPQIISMCLIMRRCTPNSALVDRVDVATPLSLSSRSVTGLSALAPAQQAGAQRLCALAQLGPPVMSAFLPLLGTSGHGASLHPSALI